jgi:shikimate kinase
MRNLYLVGARGSGKSSTAMLLGRDLGSSVWDTDDMSVARAGMSVDRFVDAEGWEAFRELESRVLREAASQGGVIATGGGMILARENREFMRRDGIVFYLHASPEILEERLARNPRPALRPPLTGLDPADELRVVTAQRDALYRESAHHVVDAAMRPRQVADSVLRHVVNFFGRQT